MLYEFIAEKVVVISQFCVTFGVRLLLVDTMNVTFS